MYTFNFPVYIEEHFHSLFVLHLKERKENLGFDLCFVLICFLKDSHWPLKYPLFDYETMKL